MMLIQYHPMLTTLIKITRHIVRAANQMINKMNINHQPQLKTDINQNDNKILTKNKLFKYMTRHITNQTKQNEVLYGLREITKFMPLSINKTMI